LGESSSIKSVEIVSIGIKSIELYKCEGYNASSWETISKAEADDADSKVQRLSLQLPKKVISAKFLRFQVSMKKPRIYKLF
jgi:hypothetical protein